MRNLFQQWLGEILATERLIAKLEDSPISQAYQKGTAFGLWIAASGVSHDPEANIPEADILTLRQVAQRLDFIAPD
jgi:hypothetical protein